MVKVARMNKMNESKVKAYVDIVYEDLVIKGFKILQDKNNELFVAYPSEKNKEGKYFNLVNPVTQVLKNEIQSVILATYKA